MSILRLRAALAAASLALATAACSVGGTTVAASGRVATESREVPAFEAVSVALPGDVILRAGPPAPVLVEADDNLLPLVETLVEEGTLRIRLKDGAQVTGRATLRVVVTAPSLKAVNLAGSGDVKADRLAAPDLSLAIAGSGDLRVDRLEAGTVHLTIAGSGDFRAVGEAAEFTARIAGSGDIDAGRLESRRVTVSIAGSGDAHVWATERLSARVAGSGDVTYRGDPAVTRSVAGSGSVHPERAGT